MSGDRHTIELLAAYALGCLDEEDSMLVSRHLARCADCRAELVSYQAVADHLALAAPEAEPPSHLKQQLMRHIQSAGSTGAPGLELTWWQRLTQVMQRTAPAWGLASLLLAVALAAGNVWLWGQLKRQPAVTEPSPMQTIIFTGTEAAPQASGILVVSVDGEHGTLVADGLPPLDAEHQYQLWLIQNGQRTSGGVFSVNPEGYGSLWVSSPQPLSTYSGFGVTIEPAGGSPGPTGGRVLGSSL